MTLKNASGSVVVGLLVLLVGLAGIVGTKDALRSSKSELSSKLSEEAPLYLPELKYVKLVTLGFDNFVSDLLWFNTINYFGKQYSGTKDYRWFAQMCDLVTALDKQAYHAYQFCGVLLAWEAKDFEKSNELLTRAIEHQPDRWRHYYLRGFNYWYFFEQYELAKKDMLAGSEIPGAPEFLAGIASRLMVDGQGVQTAINFLKDAIKNTSDQKAKKALKNKLKRGWLTLHLQTLQAAAEKYNENSSEPLKDLQQLVEAKLVKKIPKEPFKGHYLYDAEKKKVVNSSGKKGLDFRGKTAKTGIMSEEFQ